MLLPLLAPLLLAITSARAQSGALVVNLTSGAFQGTIESGGTERWLGVRFAQTPTGALRFAPPQSVTAPPAAVQNASAFGDACPQPPSGSLGAPVGEDCLHLNVRFSAYLWLHVRFRPTRSSRDACAGVAAAGDGAERESACARVVPREMHCVLFALCVGLSVHVLCTGRVLYVWVSKQVRRSGLQHVLTRVQ
jgi:hypothetical protein